MTLIPPRAPLKFPAKFPVNGNLVPVLFIRHRLEAQRKAGVERSEWISSQLVDSGRFWRSVDLSGRIFMKAHRLLAATAAAILALTSSVAIAQNRGQQGNQNRQGHTQFDQHDQQVTRDWYNQHQAHPPAGLRNQDQLSAAEESRLQEGAVLDKNLRKKVYPAPRDLSRRLPPPPSNHRYVAVGRHVGLIDNHYQVKSVIHLHDNR
jgi:Ni/Co efflux regulator RcnB